MPGCEVSWRTPLPSSAAVHKSLAYANASRSPPGAGFCSSRVSVTSMADAAGARRSEVASAPGIRMTTSGARYEMVRPVAVSELQPWFERRFAFDFPVSVYPALRVRLAGTPVRLQELASELDDELLRRKHGATWSIQENAGHLLDLEPLWNARVDDFPAGREAPTAADLTTRRTHEARHNERPLADILRAFREARLALVARLRGQDPALFARTALHPRLQAPMRLVDHLFFVAQHDDHHLAS